MALNEQGRLDFEIPQDEDVMLHEPLLDVLDTVEKLRVLRTDGRAGFLPSTHREKNQAVAALDYIDNPGHRGGVHDYLAEIYAHNKKIKRTAMAGSLAVRSVLYEFSDYAVSARHDAKELFKIKACIDDTPNPHLSLQDVVDEHDAAQLLPPILIRHMDISDVARGKFMGLHDPLLTQEYRRQLGAGKNKIVVDAYTAEEQSEYMGRYLRDRLQEVTVGSIRPMLTESMDVQRRRFTFWSNILGSRMYEYEHYAADARGLLNI